MEKAIRHLIFLCGWLSMIVLPAMSAEIYIAQNATGSDTGANCSNAHSTSWFNTNAVGGNTYHVCGTITGAAGSSVLTVPASGSAGNVVNVLFESGAIIQAPYCSQNGCISIPNRNYVTIDGGTNGIIRSTANGTGMTYEQWSTGIGGSGSNVTIRNLTIDNVYINQGYTSGATNGNGAYTWAISFTSNGTGNITIDNNILKNARASLDFSFSGGGGQNIEISNNTTREHCWGFYITANSDPNVTISNFNVHGNDIADWRRWAYPAASYHQDGIMVSGYKIVTNNAINIYGNYIHGLNGGSVTASIYCTYGYLSSASDLPGIACNLYNNLITYDTAYGTTEAIISFANGKTNYIYNNTIVGDPANLQTAIFPCSNVYSPSTMVLKNNIFANYSRVINTMSSGCDSSYGAVDYNLYYNITNGNPFHVPPDTNVSWTTWRGPSYNYDSHGKWNTNPLFVSSTNFRLQGTSPAINQGTSVISPLSFTTDYLGITRPQGGGWDIGAYEYVGRVPFYPRINPIGN